MTTFAGMTPRALLRYLADKAVALAKDRGEPVDRVRKKIAFDFLLRRLALRAPGQYVLKGGYAIELKFQVMRATRDLDIVTRRLSSTAAGRDAAGALDLLRQRLVDHLADPAGKEDHAVAFRVDDEGRTIAGGGGGAQFGVRMLIDRQRFTEFGIDLSLEDIKGAMTQTLPLRPLVDGFAVPASATFLTDEQIFAEKLHAYMRHGEGFQARTKDFADLVLLSQRPLDAAQCRTLIDQVFAYWRKNAGRSGLKSLPPPPVSANDLREPPDTWRPIFERMAQELRLDPDLDRAYQRVKTCMAKILAPKRKS